MTGTSRTTLLECVKFALRPVVRLCLRHSIKLQDLLECCKIVLLEEAKQEIQAGSQSISVSRLSIMTGVHRPDVMRLYREGAKTKPVESAVTRIIGQWQQDKRFRTPGGKPRTLSVEGTASEFAQLVAAVSRDLNPYTVLFELERMRAVERTSKGLRLKTQLYMPGGNIKEGFEILSRDADDMFCAVEHNLFNSEETPNLHIRTEYDNIVAGSLPAIRKWLLKEGSIFHARARNYLSRFDRDINKELKADSAPVRVVLGSFSRVAGSDLKHGE